MRWSWISKSLIQVQKEENSSLTELIHVYASSKKREIMQAFSRRSRAVTAKKCTKKCQRCTCNRCFAKKANCCLWRSRFSVVITSAFIFWEQQNYLFSLDKRAPLRLRWLVLQLPFVDKLEVAAWSLPNCDERGVEIDEMFTELLAVASLDVLTTSLERLFFKSPPSSFFTGEKYSFMDFCWGLGSDLFGFLGGTGFLSFEEGLFREAILKAQMSRANNILAINGQSSTPKTVRLISNVLLTLQNQKEDGG